MTEKPSFLKRLNDWRLRVFPERQLFLRSEGRVRFLTIPSVVQVGISCALFIALGWASVTSVYFFLRDGELKERDLKLAEVSADYQNLSTDFSALEKDIEARTALLEERQQLLETLLDRKPIKQAALKVQVSEAENKAQRQNTPSDQTTDSAQPIPLEDNSAAKEPAQPEQSAFDMSAAAPTPETLAENRTALSYADVVLAHAASLDPAQRRKSLLGRLQDLEQRQRQLTNAMLQITSGSVQAIDDALSPVKLTSERLIASSDDENRYEKGDLLGVGGPFIPVGKTSGIKPIFASSDVQPLENLLNRLVDHETVLNVLAAMPFGKPAENYRLSSRFGRRRDPFRKSWSNHPGIDLAGWPGNAILATAPGVVVKAKYHAAYGRMIELDHGNGFRTRFGHMRKLLVKLGDKVTPGQKIGEMGKTGRATDTHLHYEVWFNGKLQDPLPYVRKATDVFKVQEQFKDNVTTASR